MKLYNPFRWHVVMKGKYFAVRKLCLDKLGWGVADRSFDGYVWGSSHYSSTCINTRTEAVKLAECMQ